MTDEFSFTISKDVVIEVANQYNRILNGTGLKIAAEVTQSNVFGCLLENSHLQELFLSIPDMGTEYLDLCMKNFHYNPVFC